MGALTSIVRAVVARLGGTPAEQSPAVVTADDPSPIEDPGPLDEPVTIVELSFWLPAHRMPATAAPVIEVISSVAPDFLPHVYGDRDPAQLRAGARGSSFAAYWTEQAARGGTTIAWRGRGGALDAAVWVPAGGAAQPTGRACGRLRLHHADIARFDSRQATGLLTDLADRLHAIYASAWVLGGYAVRHGGLVVNADTDTADEAAGMDWIGLPPTPPWLAWYGPAYVAIVKDHVDGHPARSGLLVGDPTMYPAPARYSTWEAAAAAGHYLPAELLVGRRDVRFWRTAPDVPAASIPETVPGDEVVAEWRVLWGVSEPASVGSMDELDALLDHLQAEAEAEPFMVTVMSPRGDTLTLGLGREESVLSWVADDGDPPYFASKGPRDGDDPVTVFFFGGHWSEFPDSACIPIADARQAVREFVASGRRPDSVEWVEV